MCWLTLLRQDYCVVVKASGVTSSSSSSSIRFSTACWSAAYFVHYMVIMGFRFILTVMLKDRRVFLFRSIWQTCVWSFEGFLHQFKDFVGRRRLSDISKYPVVCERTCDHPLHWVGTPSMVSPASPSVGSRFPVTLRRIADLTLILCHLFIQYNMIRNIITSFLAKRA